MPIVRFWVAVISVCCVALGPPLAQAAANSTITIAVPEEPAPFDTCAVGTIAASRILLNNVADAITAYIPETNAVVPSLATSWKQTSPATWEFNLRSGVRFSDGTPFNAAAAATSIKRTFNHALNCSVASQIFAGEQVVPEAIGNTRLRLTTSRPDPILPLRATFLAISAPSTESDRNTEHPIGTGAYKVDNWAHGTSITLVPNPFFNGPKPKITQVTYVFRPEARVRVDMVNTGEADMALSLPPEFASQKGALQFDPPEVILLRMDALTAPFNDKRVRQGVLSAIDRPGLIKALYGGNASVATQAITRNVPGFNPHIVPPRYDPALAKKLIAEAKASGVPVDKPMKIYNRAGLVLNGQQLAEALAEELDAVGLNVSVDTMDVAPWVEILFSHPADRSGLLLEDHANNLGDPSLTVDARFDPRRTRSQVPKEDQSTVANLIRLAENGRGEQRTALFQKLFAFMATDATQDAYIAAARSTMLVGPRVSYKPNWRSNQLIPLANVHLRQ